MSTLYCANCLIPLRRSAPKPGKGATCPGCRDRYIRKSIRRLAKRKADDAGPGRRNG